MKVLFRFVSGSYFDGVVQANGLKDGVEIVITVCPLIKTRRLKLIFANAGSVRNECIN